MKGDKTRDAIVNCEMPVVYKTSFIKSKYAQGGYNLRKGKVSMSWHPDLHTLSMVTIYSL